MIIIFWVILAILYLALAIVTYLSRRRLGGIVGPVERRFGIASENSNGQIINVEKVLYLFLKHMFIIDLIGFIFAAAAALITAFTLPS